MRRDGRGHRLHEVVEFVQASLDNRLTESFEAPNVEHDVVVNEKDGARASGLRITADMYTYPAGATGLDAAMPTWVQSGG